MTDHELRLLAIATLAASPAVLVDVFSEPIKGSEWTLYSVELVDEIGTRWFALHGKALSAARDFDVLLALSAQFAAPAALAPPA